MPFHTIIPSFIFRDYSAGASAGGAGGATAGASPSPVSSPIVSKPPESLI